MTDENNNLPVPSDDTPVPQEIRGLRAQVGIVSRQFAKDAHHALQLATRIDEALWACAQIAGREPRLALEGYEAGVRALMEGVEIGG